MNTPTDKNAALATLQAVVNMTDGHVQEMVRHALSSLSAERDSEPVAWLYEAEGFATAFSKTRLPKDAMFGNPTETPLYAAPVAPASSEGDIAAKLNALGTATKPASATRPNHLEICQAVARGWCSPNNAHKEMDVDLAFAIAVQVEALLARSERTDQP